MGLDMYFEVEEHSYESFAEWQKEGGKSDTTDYPECLKELADNIYSRNFKSKSTYTYYQVGYFRKFNALHNLIVNSLANGVDECQKIYLSKNEISNILDICKHIKEDHSRAEELLPTTDGFFFGSTEYDEWYFEDINNACELFENIIKYVDFDKFKVVYQASW